MFLTLKRRSKEVESHSDLFTDRYRYCLNYRFVKLKDYYNLSDRSRIYRAVIALYPYYRHTYFEQVWTNISAAEISRAKQTVHDLYAELLEELSHELTIEPLRPPPSPREQQDFDED